MTQPSYHFDKRYTQGQHQDHQPTPHLGYLFSIPEKTNFLRRHSKISKKYISVLSLLRKLVSITAFFTFSHIIATSSLTPLPIRRLIGGNTACAGPRIRKSWDSMSSAEHELYLEAVEASIAAGTHQAMVNIHVDFTSELVTHDTCGFTLWHRRYLLAYENMLRSTAHKFRCVTVPYRNIMDHYVNMINGQCSNLVDCSPILTGLGGIPKNHLVNNRTYAGIFRTVV